jgi:choline dehydrogenase-like flavoprotein
MDNRVTHPDSFQPDHRSIVIAGGGIAGLHCARELARASAQDITVLERSDRWGGRIETGYLGPVPAEWGPMRFELAIQPLFRKLCDELSVTFDVFPGASAGSQDWPHYLLPPHELAEDNTAPDSLNLLRMGIFKMLGEKDLRWNRVEHEDGSTGWRLDPASDILDSLGTRAQEDEFRRSRKLALEELPDWDPYLYELGF